MVSVVVVVVFAVDYFEDRHIHVVLPRQSTKMNRYLTQELIQTQIELGSIPEHSTVVNRLNSGLKHQWKVDNSKHWWYKNQNQVDRYEYGPKGDKQYGII